MMPSESLSRRTRESRTSIGGRGALTEEGARAGPVADDVHGVEVTRIAGSVEEALAAGGRALPGPPALALVDGRRLGSELVGEPLSRFDQPRNRGRAFGLGLAGVRVVLADVRGHARLRSVKVRGLSGARDGDPVTASCERGASPVPRSIAHGSCTSTRTIE